MLERGQIDTAATIRFHADLGVKAIEIPDYYIREGEIPAIEAALAETDTAVSCYDIFCNFDGPNGEPSPAQVENARRGVEHAARLGAPRALVVAYKIEERAAPDLVRRHYAGLVKELLPTARRLGITLTSANLGIYWRYFGKVDHIHAVRAEVGPELRLTYDIGNFLMAGEDPLDCLNRVAPLVDHVHLKDWSVRPATTDRPGSGGYQGQDGRYYYSEALGEGVLDVPGVVGRLRELGYRGFLSVEWEAPGDPRPALRRSMTYLRNLLAG
jgi:sugar phosphate isomerase/epimerase